MKPARGPRDPAWEWAVRRDPEFAEAYDTVYRQALGTDEGRRVFQRGAMRVEVLGVPEVTAGPGGAVTPIDGLRALRQVEHEE